MNNLYNTRNIEAIDDYKNGNYYFKHISAMTREKLHSKSDIAAELAIRDIKIKDLLLLLKALEPEIYSDIIKTLPEFIYKDEGGV